ncbi:LacI family DNA-binding transcriptional regulator [Acidicapsa ligni]|uniref:LacI family DNA-binding transcriptional regulator n=1 Tax=Acidicapsa ligni TaxID=542300 RepID=UPI0021E0C272|nr:LacI family DNA-binding transcriptional regulator [Acidicapsa ligni]
MKDIAKDLGVSVVTVSKVLRNHSDIGEETRERVLKRVKELDYRPNLTAQSLVTGRTFLVGLIVPDLVHSFFAEVARFLSNALRQEGYYLVISSSEEDPSLEEREIDQLLGRNLDALIIASASASPAIFRRIEEQQTPFVLIDRQFPGFPANFVGVDDESVGRLATNHLIENGSKRIAHLRGPESTPGVQRLAGYKHALQNSGLKFNPAYLLSPGNVDVDSLQQGYSAMKKLLAIEPRPDGVFCYNDPLAIGAIDCILDAGLRVPGDIAVIGCGNLHFNTSLRVSLSSVNQHSRQIGECTAQLVLQMIKSKTPLPPRNIIVEAEVIARRSTLRS